MAASLGLAQPVIPSSPRTASLVLGFQNPGGATGSTQIVYVNLGNVNWYRGPHASYTGTTASPGSFTTITNIGSLLSAQFGSSWFDTTTLWVSAMAARGVSSLDSTTLQTGDPALTFYAGRQRSVLGTPGEVSSTPIVVAGVSQSQARIQVLRNELTGTIVGDDGPATKVLTTGTSFLEEDGYLEIFSAAGLQLQSPAFGDIAGGIQGNFGAGSLGTFGSAGSIELAMDLFRVQNRNDLTGQFGAGTANNLGLYLGTITINSAGDVGYTAAIPEPTSLLLLSAAGSILLMRRRRSKL